MNIQEANELDRFNLYASSNFSLYRAVRDKARTYSFLGHLAVIFLFPLNANVAYLTFTLMRNLSTLLHFVRPYTPLRLPPIQSCIRSEDPLWRGDYFFLRSIVIYNQVGKPNTLQNEHALSRTVCQ